MVSNRKAGVLKRERNRGKHSWGSTEPMGSSPRRQLVRVEGDNNRGLHGNSDVIVTSGKRLYGRIKQKRQIDTNKRFCVFNAGILCRSCRSLFQQLPTRSLSLLCYFMIRCEPGLGLELLLTLAHPGQVYSAAAQVFGPLAGRHHLALIAAPQRTGTTSIKPPSFSFQPVCVCVCVYI